MWHWTSQPRHPFLPVTVAIAVTARKKPKGPKRNLSRLKESPGPLPQHSILIQVIGAEGDC